MARNDFISRLARIPRWKILVTVLVYAISSTLRFTSAVGEEAESPRPCRVAPEHSNPTPSLHLFALSSITTNLAAAEVRQR